MPALRLMRLRALCAAALSLVLATPASAGGFCDSIKAIANDAPNGFTAFRGTPTKQEFRYDHYAATGWPDGALTCEIEVATDENIPNQAPYTDYTCNFPMGAASKPAAVRTFAKSLQRCIKGLKIEPGTKLTKDGGSLLVTYRPGIVGFAVIAMPEAATLRLNISNR